MYVAPAAMHASQLLSAGAAAVTPDKVAAAAATASLPLIPGGVLEGLAGRLRGAVAAAVALPPGRRLALAGDVALLLYGVIGQMVVGTVLSYRNAMKKNTAPVLTP